MPILLDTDWAAIALEAFGDLVLDGTLTAVRPVPRDSDASWTEPSVIETDHAFRGFIKTLTSAARQSTSVPLAGEAVLIIGNSLPAGVVPQIDDRIRMESRDFRVVHVRRDPAAALYTCEVN